VAPNDAALRHTHRRFVTPGYGHTTGATMVRVANVRQKLMQAITNEDRKYTDLNTDDVAFIVGLIEDELSGYALIDPQVRQLLVHPVVRFYLQEHLQTSVEHRDLLTGWYASETYSNDYVSHIPADNASFGTDAIVLNIVAKNDGSPGVPISLSEYVLGWPATKLPAQTFTPLAQRIPRLTSNERRVLQMVLARWALDGDAATSEQKAMLQLYRGRYLDEAILDTMTNGQTLHPVTQKYVDGLVTRVASGQFSVRESEAKLALQLISHSDASQVSSRLFDWQAHYEMCCGIESKFHANTVSSLDDLSPTEKAVINRLYLRVVSKATPDPAFGEVEEAIMLHAMSVGLLPENTLYVANAMCGRIMAKLQESVEGVPALNAAEHAFIQRMPELMKTHKWPIGNAADMVVVLFADPAYFTFNPPLKPEDRNEVTARFLDVRVRQVQAMVTQRAHLGIRDRALGRMFGESMYTRIYGMDEAALFALKEAVIPGSSGQSILNLAVERRGDGRLEMVLSPGDNIDAAEGNGTLENLFASMFKSGDDAGISVEDGLARVRVRVLEVDADPSVDNRLRLNGLDDLGAATRRRSAATGLQLVLEQYSGQLAPMNIGHGAVVAEMESVGRGGTQERLRDAVQHGELTMSYVTQSPENGFKEEHILVTLPLSPLAALNSDTDLKAALNQLIGVAGGKVRFAIQDDAGHVFYVDTRNAGTTNPPRAVYNALDIATKINAFKALDFPHRLETVVEEGTRYLRIALVPETPETWDKWHSAIYEGDRAKYHGKMDCLKELLASGVQVKLGATASGDIVFGAPTAANLTGEFGGVLNFIRSHHKTQVFKLIYDAVDVASVDLQGYFKGKMDSLRVFATQLNAALDTHLITVANTIHGNGQVVAITLSKFTYTEEEKAQLHALLAAAKAVWGQQGNSAITLPVLFRQQDGQRIGANLTDAAAVTDFISA
ncbi:MAG: hypothetical protein O3A01_09085, partial [bacterium]|nr:hypothetical protein [bacterium]